MARRGPVRRAASGRPTFRRVIISKTDLAALLEARHASPHSVLGMHPITHKKTAGVVVRAFLAGATGCDVVEVDAQPSKTHAMTRLAPEGVCEVFIP